MSVMTYCTHASHKAPLLTSRAKFVGGSGEDKTELLGDTFL
jgi:hypothetical protein